MKFKIDIIVDMPIQTVLELFDDRENLPHWQPELKSYKLISGEAGHPGAKTKMVYDISGREVEMTETVAERNLPALFSATYEAKGVLTHVENRFESVDAGKTRWTNHSMYRFSGAMKFMGPLISDSFKKKTIKMMQHFKQFAERTAES